MRITFWREDYGGYIFIIIIIIIIMKEYDGSRGFTRMSANVFFSYTYPDSQPPCECPLVTPNLFPTSSSPHLSVAGVDDEI